MDGQQCCSIAKYTVDVEEINYSITTNVLNITGGKGARNQIRTQNAENIYSCGQRFTYRDMKVIEILGYEYFFELFM